ncbi:DEAD/DEAH box helicase family protein [Clostridium perfringens]
MAIKKSDSKKSKSKKKMKPLSEQLVLNKFFLNLFGASDFAKDFDYLKDESLEGYDENCGQSKFILKILENNKYKLSEEKLLQLDKNIKRHTNMINMKREYKIKWKYFQYLSLLFTEIYFDYYFSNKELFINNLNEYLDKFNEENNIDLKDFSEENIKKIALWNATGSGKTLIMHINILQYRHYINQYNKSKELNKIIILTPNEGLAKQHLEELKKSNIKSNIFTDDINLFNLDNKNVSVIDLHKIKRQKGDKTVALDSFETNNFVLIDEGHIGISSKSNSYLSWNEIRKTMCEDGFSIEYSATFEQAIDSKGKDGSLEEYSKSILFDYSYKYFYNDGFGKDYRILNMSSVNENNSENKFRYLVGSLLSFYQQLKLFNDNDFEDFNIYEPLMIFVGSKVNAVRKEKPKEVSDVVDILLFFDRFIKNNKDEVLEVIQDILKGRSGLYSGNSDLFINKLSYVNQIYINSNIESLYLDIKKVVFNSNSMSGSLKLENLKSVGGEIAIRINDNDAFGVINVGDTDKLIKLCESNGLTIMENTYHKSLFNKIKESDSKVKILIGSKKFTEGWDSWRVSSIGLMNIGKNEGSQIIQLFGRGIRLQGYNRSLKRSTALAGKIDRLIPEDLKILETLNIFGINADYMKEFKEMLAKEGVSDNEEKIDIKIPILRTVKSEELKKLKVIRVKDGLTFKKDAPNLVLTEKVSNYFKENKIKLDLYTKIDEVKSKKSFENGFLNKERNRFSRNKLFFMDIEKIYFEIINYKKERCFYNINISKEKITDLLLDDSWYEIYIPKSEFKASFNNKNRLEEIAIMLLQKYIDKFFKKKKSEWESDKLEYVELDYNNFVKNDSYNIEVNSTQVDVINNINLLKERLNKAKSTDEIKNIDYDKYSNNQIKFIGFDKHIYNPLVSMDIKLKDIKVTPVELNDGEARFVNMLKDYISQKSNKLIEGKEFYLIRNPVGNVGFFDEGNFYPDFIMWIIDSKSEYITFIDPKGLRNEGVDSRKVMLHKRIKNYQNNLNSSIKYKNIILNSIILSKTNIEEMKILYPNLNKQDYLNRNIFFINDELVIEDILNKIFL